MLVNNLIASSILIWSVMPLVTQLLRFWLRPAYRLSSDKIDLSGLALVVTVLGVMVSAFNHV